MRQTLDHDYDKGLAAASPENSYYYKSEYVEISAHRSEGRDKPVTTSLEPARAFGLAKRVGLQSKGGKTPCQGSRVSDSGDY